MKLGTSDVKREVTQARKEYDAGGVLSDEESHRRSFYERKLYEYSEYASHADLSDHIEDALSLLEDAMIKYVDSGWLAGQDQASLAKNLEDLHDQMNNLNNTFNQLAATGKVRG